LSRRKGENLIRSKSPSPAAASGRLNAAGAGRRARKLVGVIRINAGSRFSQADGPMAWSDRIAPPLGLSDGRKLTTLGDASLALMALPEHDRTTGLWLKAARSLLNAAEDGEPAAELAVHLFGAFNAVFLI
jgi:hypothetical protein